MSEQRVDQARKGELPRVGETLENAYRLENVVASGGMGVIMKATDLKMERDVAVKLLHPHMAEREDTAKRFEREIHLAKVLSHPNIIQLFDYGQTPNEALYTVMEYLEGEDLDALINRQAPLAVDRTLEIALQILDGLAEAHERNVIHRDLKPSNVFLTERRRGGEHVKLLDFGIAKSLERAGTAVTSTGQICGTAMYMPPESIFQKSPGKRGDVYAIGLLILEMLLGRRVFDAETMPQTLMMHVQQPVPIPTDIMETPLGECLKRATTKHPDDRYRDAETMLDDLAAAAEQMEISEAVDPNDITETGSSVSSKVFPNTADSDLDMEMLRDAPSHESADALPRDAPPDTPAPSSPADRKTPGDSEDTDETDPSAPTIVSPPSRQRPQTGSEEAERKETEKLPGLDTGDASRPESSERVTAEAGAVAGGSWWERYWQPIAAGAATLAVVGLVGWLIALRNSPREVERTADETASPPPSTEEAPPADQPAGESGSVLSLVPVSLRSEPAGASVLVDGKPVGRTPTDIDLPAGSGAVALTIRKPGYADETIEIDPADDPDEYTVELDPEETEPSAESAETTAPLENSSGAEPPSAGRDRESGSSEPTRTDSSGSDPADSEQESDSDSHDLMQVEEIDEPAGSESSDDGSGSSDDFENIADEFTVD